MLRCLDGFTKLGAALGMVENFGPDIRKPQAALRAFEQADAELVLEISDCGG
jgi:hypothetical protein